LDYSTHCGVFGETNDDYLEDTKDIAPIGKYPWIVQITDEYDVSFMEIKNYINI
jgi:hypothetical protein